MDNITFTKNQIVARLDICTNELLKIRMKYCENPLKLPEAHSLSDRYNRIHELLIICRELAPHNSETVSDFTGIIHYLLAFERSDVLSQPKPEQPTHREMRRRKRQRLAHVAI